MMKHRMIINLCKQDPFKSIGGKGSHRQNHKNLHEPFDLVNLTGSVNLAGSMGVRAVPVSSLHVAMQANETQVTYYVSQLCVNCAY